MHHCLSIPEILSLICQEFSEDPEIHWHIDDRKALVSLACTSRSWSEPALRVLWYSVDGIDKLFHSLAKDLWERFYDEDPLVLNRPLSPEDMKVFRKYATWIRVFTERDDKNITLYRALFACGYSCLLPRLEALSWQIENPDLFPYLRLLISPSLRKLGTFFSDGSLVMEQLNMLEAIPSMFPPGISNLSLGSKKDDLETQFPGLEPARKALVDVLHSWSNVTDLELDEIPLETLGCIVDMPSLTRLVFIAESDPLEYPPPEPNFRSPSLSEVRLKSPCPLLESITIDQTPVSTIHAMFKALARLQLRYLSLSLSEAGIDTLGGIEAFFKRLGQAYRAAYLE
ncbi:hypothetical protein NP233_g2389 [Leucocoprinus birnbaumii]|uniref:F-box domain-containing protein n=1 Tax=Leucocoprinus birnbaumii TaxID=56174 RepID=A0AAD5VYD9_9AGAR|nr:hypothetical protein NP233_g2389 [Leucocoprinus birnbaumii]